MDTVTGYLDRYYLESDTPNEELVKKLGQAICESASWIIVILPRYGSKLGCLREFMAMEQVETKRKQILGNKYERTMIFPFLLTGKKDHYPPQIRERLPVDLDIKYSLQIPEGYQYAFRKYEEIIYPMVEDISAHYENLKVYETDDECNKVILPSPSYDELDKFWPQEKIEGFPGRPSILD